MQQHKTTRNMTTTTTTTTTMNMDACTYWTAMALEVTPAAANKVEVGVEVEVEVEDKDDEFYKHKYGLCDDCGVGLDDESDFVVHEYFQGVAMYLCIQCWHSPCPWSVNN